MISIFIWAKKQNTMDFSPVYHFLLTSNAILYTEEVKEQMMDYIFTLNYARDSAGLVSDGISIKDLEPDLVVKYNAAALCV